MLKLVLGMTVMFTLLAGGLAVWLAVTAQGSVLVRLRVADRLALAAMLGALAVYGLLALPE